MAAVVRHPTTEQIAVNLIKPLTNVEGFFMLATTLKQDISQP